MRSFQSNNVFPPPFIIIITMNHKTFCLLTGIVVGFTIAFVFLAPSTVYRGDKGAPVRRTKDSRPPRIDSSGHEHEHDEFHREEDMENLRGPDQDVGEHNENDTHHRMTDSRIADALYNKVKVLCWVMTAPKNHDAKAKHIKATWGKRCNVLLFMSSQEDKTLPAVALNVSEGRNNLWAKTKSAFEYVYRKHFDDADWFMKADDDTYVVVENLRYMLRNADPQQPVYYGCKFKPYVKQGYMSGGAGYVLSKEALRRFVEEAIPNKKMCRKDPGGAEDVELGKCMQAVKVKAGDSRDAEHRGRFFPFDPAHHLIPGHTDRSFWYWSYVFYEEKQGMECCSDTAISFHYIGPHMMYEMEYLIYHLKPFGIGYNPSLD
ncbi:unnamed protein product [Phyllotreta striolata]|uniref:Glycoprotein-N-acetylgalactosamine 3-beta-galactosyltransferase 1 n=1 Tax=Phyllotreta striolata TaxID=444603 RepID=A0A9N9TUK3_PHYSR|nr:unnamed protein product [Phyllotreta striolata]